MKKLVLIAITAAFVAACSQPKDIYFNGSDGSHSGLKYDKASGSFGVNR
ncbi:hypothetical protein [Actinobacillus porcinus]|uniref:Lipoprotein n=1 Tax=Actinobacillus porcinus TaxID=51048 RepID=A0ABY6TLZ7_9PAST|nr:hypothetical protein [Actinobacillus porcinus]MCI5763409.1 hypothetical protein [Actinobacillus porcinus]MDD7544419.1 hypothetical protein [Actinobacillus porcinus]MDY5422306.1 hypothetical protein [Actinobacillus porcinus]MDY5847193.1 hypothetical protein [Actinobacillus porcinus]MDY6215729.1 hypothetical protein [Actinobacillus porcinus]